MKSSDYLEKAIEWVQKKGFFDIKSVHESYETPSAFKSVEGEKEITPAITGYLRGGKNYIEIATKTSQVSKLVSKWKLFSIIASNKGGNLYLLAPRGHKSFTDQIIQEYGITAKVVYLK